MADPTFTYACWAAAVAVLLAFGTMALWLSRKHARDQDLQVRWSMSIGQMSAGADGVVSGRSAKALTDPSVGIHTHPQTFITARRSQPLLRVAWSFYAGSIGWCVQPTPLLLFWLGSKLWAFIPNCTWQD